MSSFTCASHTSTHLQHYSTPISPETFNLLYCSVVKIPCAQWQATQHVLSTHVCVCTSRSPEPGGTTSWTIIINLLSRVIPAGRSFRFVWFAFSTSLLIIRFRVRMILYILRGWQGPSSSGSAKQSGWRSPPTVTMYYTQLLSPLPRCTQRGDIIVALENVHTGTYTSACKLSKALLVSSTSNCDVLKVKKSTLENTSVH